MAREVAGEEGPRGGSRRALLWFVVAAVVLDWAAGAALGAHYHDYGGVRRNPTPWHLWPDFVRSTEPHSPGEFLVLVISHSQAYAPEVPEEALWTARLEHELAARGVPSPRVVNWSPPAANAPDFVVLLAAGRRLHPDVTLLVAGPANFARKHRFWKGSRAPLRLQPSDVRYLVGYADVRQNLPEAFRRFYLDVHERLDDWLYRFVPLWRYRTLSASLLWHVGLQPLSGERDFPGWELPPIGPPPPAEGKLLPFRLDPTLAHWVAEAFAGMPGRRIQLSSPVHSNARVYPDFAGHAARMFERAGVESWDWTDAFDDARFVTNSHYDAEGHAELARRIAERIAP